MPIDGGVGDFTITNALTTRPGAAQQQNHAQTQQHKARRLGNRCHTTTGGRRIADLGDRAACRDGKEFADANTLIRVAAGRNRARRTSR